MKTGLYFENAYTSIPSITNAMQPTIVSGTTPKYTNNHYRYYDKEKDYVVQENPARINYAETIAESLLRQNEKFISINQFALEDRGAFKNDLDHFYVSVKPDKNGMARFDYGTQLIKEIAKKDVSEAPRLIAMYMDELDDLGHNDKEVHGIQVAETEVERIERVMQGLEILDEKLGEFIAVIEENNLTDHFTVILTTDHGMTNNGVQSKEGPLYRTDIYDLKETIEELGYQVEVLGANTSRVDKNTDLVIVTVGLQAQLSYPKLTGDQEIDQVNEEILEAVRSKEYFGKALSYKELAKRGVKRGFADLMISPKPAHSFKLKLKDEVWGPNGQHDSLDDSSQRVPLLLWGNKIPENKRIKAQVFVTSVAPTISALLDKNLPLDATADSLAPYLYLEKNALTNKTIIFNEKFSAEERIVRIDFHYFSLEDVLFELFINDLYVRDIFFPNTYGKMEAKRINVTLEKNDELKIVGKANGKSRVKIIEIVKYCDTISEEK